MIDYATNERRAWIKRLQTGERPDNWVLHRRYSPRPDHVVELEYEARAQAAWAKTRAIGGKV